MADDNPHADQQQELVTWMTVKQAAASLGVSADTVRRRLGRGELEGRRETIPQGFRYLVRVDPAHIEAVGSPESDETSERGVQVPSTDIAAVTVLQRELELRNREVASLHAVIADLARALKDARSQEAAVQAEAGDEVVAHQGDDSDAPAGVWSRLARWWKGQ